MDSSRINEKVFLWDYEQSNASWSNEIQGQKGLLVQAAKPSET